MNHTLRRAYIAAVLVFFYLPVVVLILYSFNNAHYSLLWHGFTWHWYGVLFADTALWSATLHSFYLATLAATVATLMGTLAAISLVRQKFYGKQLLYGSLFALIICPDIVIGIALLILFNIGKLQLGFWSLLFSHITFCIPFVVLTVYSRMTTIETNLFEAAYDLGASEFILLSRIIFPLLAPAIMAAFLLTFTLSFDDVIISYFVSGPSFPILPLKIFSLVKQGTTPEMNALCSLIFLLTITVVLVAHQALKK